MTQTDCERILAQVEEAANDAHTRLVDALGAPWVSDGAPISEGIRRKVAALENAHPEAAAVVALVEAVLGAHRDDVPPRIRELARAARDAGGNGAPNEDTVAVPRDLLEGIVYDLDQGLTLEDETVVALDALLGGRATAETRRAS